MTRPLGVTGTVVVEASPWPEDNQWVLDLAKRHPVIAGVVGHLEPGRPEFAGPLERFARDPLFRGIRLHRVSSTGPQFFADLKRVADADLQIDVLGGPAMLPDVVRLTDRVPDLRIVIDHLPFDPPREAGAFRAALRELGQRRRVYAKVSGVLRRPERTAAQYRSALEELWGIFGPDRVIYGSNWPVSDLIAPYADVLRVVQDFVTAKGQAAAEKYFWRNSLAAYRWVKRA
jgi:predicted TIM-barrel fold metal-dependent hydrolase